jgi:predicted DNA-binding protein
MSKPKRAKAMAWDSKVEPYPLRMPKELIDRIRKVAKQERRRPSNFICWALEKFLDQNYGEENE